MLVAGNTRISGKRIGVDIDDVLYPWYERAHEVSVAAGIANGATPTSWSPFDQYGCTAEEWYAALAEATRDGRLYGADPYPGVVEALARIQDAGHVVHLITARGFLQHGELIRKLTCDWLYDHHIPHDTLTFSKRKAVVTTDHFIDDSEKNVRELAAAGVDVSLMNQPHNQHVTGFNRVNHISEFVERILGHDR